VNGQARRGPRAGHQLPPGPHGLSRAFVARNQRERILAAVADATADGGYSETSVEDIIARAGVSRRTFYDIFKNKQDAFLAAYDEAVRRLLWGVRDASSEEDLDFADRITAALGAFLAALVQSPSFGRMCVVEVLAAGPEAVRRRNDAMATFAALIREYALEHLGSEPASPIAAELLVGGIYETVYSRLADGQVGELEGLLPELVYAVLVSYLGEAAAAEARHRLLHRATPSRATAA
jgi:AcrR family transcriptional regulator